LRLGIFFNNLAQLEEAPNGIPKLRQLIVQLAIEGKLVAQDPRDEPASLLLERSRNGTDNRRRLSRLGSISAARVGETLPFGIPSSWEWTSLSQVGHEWGQKKPDVDFTYIDVASIDNKRGAITDELKLLKSNEAPSRARKIVKRGSIIYATVRPYLLNIAIVDKDYSPEPIASTAFAVIHPFDGISATYLFYYLRSRTFVDFVEEQMQGVAYPAINDEKLFTAPVPLPPFKEQERIVRKVEELMLLCDELEARQQAKVESRVRLNTVVLAPLKRAASLAPEEFEQATTRLADNFDTLYDSIDPLAQFRSAILKLAVQGNLAPQLNSEEPACLLFEKIGKVKKSLLEAGKIQKDKKPWSFTKDQSPWKIPSNWLWVRLQDLFEISRGGSPRPSGDPLYFGGKIPWITVGEITKDNSKYLHSTSHTLTDEGKKRSRTIYPDDLLLTNSGATLGVPKISKIEGCINDGVALLRQFHSYDINDYAYLFLTSQTDEFRGVKQGMGQPNLNTSILSGWFFPLPPLNEQKRIVAKVNELMSLCDELEAKLRQAEADSEKLMNAAVKHVLDCVRDVSKTAEEVFA
jgi:type I restriction enzyme, S subunit